MTREELLAALTVERYDQTWWKTPPPIDPADIDNDLAHARRQRALLDNDSAHDYAKEA